MDLVITTYGAYLHRKGDLFAIRAEGKEQSVASRKVRSILISTAASLSTDAIQLALEKNIDILFIDRFGNPYGRVWHGRPGSTTTIRRNQLRLADSPRGLDLARGWMNVKLKNQIAFLEAARKKRSRLSAPLTSSIDALRSSVRALEGVRGVLDEARGALMGIEGNAARIYWTAVSQLLPEKYQFQGRSRNPARDEFNCLLNYAYGVLYGTVERACMLAGLDPYVGFIHTDHYNKPSLVFDLIEGYRVWADETVVGLFASREVKAEHFDPLQNGLTLNREGKSVLMGRLGSYLEEGVRHRGRNVKRRDIVQLDCHVLAQELIDGSDLPSSDMPEVSGHAATRAGHADHERIDSRDLPMSDVSSSDPPVSDLAVSDLPEGSAEVMGTRASTEAGTGGVPEGWKVIWSSDDPGEAGDPFSGIDDPSEDGET